MALRIETVDKSKPTVKIPFTAFTATLLHSTTYTVENTGGLKQLFSWNIYDIKDPQMSKIFSLQIDDGTY